MKRHTGTGLGFALVLGLVGGVASAQSEELVATPSTGYEDGGRFRFGVAAGGGLMSWDGPTLEYGGVDLRFGLQVNDEIGVYAQPQLGVYAGDIGGRAIGTGGLIGMSGVVDYTVMDQLFIGGGLGYAILNAPSGFELHFRAGGYPILSSSTDAPRRKAVMLGADLRLHFVEGFTFIAPTLNIGYEAY